MIDKKLYFRSLAFVSLAMICAHTQIIQLLPVPLLRLSLQLHWLNVAPLIIFFRSELVNGKSAAYRTEQFFGGGTMSFKNVLSASQWVPVFFSDFRCQKYVKQTSRSTLCCPIITCCGTACCQEICRLYFNLKNCYVVVIFFFFLMDLTPIFAELVRPWPST